MDDLISRQAAIDLLKQMRKDGDMIPWEGKDVFARIRKLPSAQPDTTTHDSIPAETDKNDGDRTSGDCISRTQAIEAVCEEVMDRFFVPPSAGYNVAEEALKKLPSAQPERKTGRWITDDSELGIKCNKCGKSFSDYVNAGTEYMFLEEIPNFCPNCGEDLRGEG